jgi:hypothetical protein
MPTNSTKLTALEILACCGFVPDFHLRNITMRCLPQSKHRIVMLRRWCAYFEVNTALLCYVDGVLTLR